jgi:hypothetical protein
MKALTSKIILIIAFSIFIVTCKKAVYPDLLQLIVVDKYTNQPIANAQVQIYKVRKHPFKIGNNAKDDAWFPDYGRKEIEEIQTAVTDENGKVSFKQAHKNYQYIIPAAFADGYQIIGLDTLNKLSKYEAKDGVYKLALQPKIKTMFIFKSQKKGFEKDSVLFSCCDKVKVMRGAHINDRLEVYTSNYNEPYVKVWYGGTIYRGGKKVTLCHYVIAYPNANNEFNIDIDID